MKLLLINLILFLIFIIVSSSSSSYISTTSSSNEQPIPYDGWELIFEDEFNGDTLNLDFWNPIYQSYDYNAELEIYIPDNIIVSDGYLNIISKKQDYENHNYTSGKLTTSKKFNTTFGRVEAFAKLPSGQGMWPAFWMMPETDECWPLAGEIDIMESIGFNTIYGTYHFSTQCGVNSQEGGNTTLSSFSDSFNLYSVIWTEDTIIWMINNQQYFQIKNNDFLPIPSTIPFYLILNTAVGGDWGGNPISSTVFPQNFTIDYVRVYKQSE